MTWSMVLISACLNSSYQQLLSRLGKSLIPAAFGVIPVDIDRRHSRNLAWAARNCAKEFVRCSSSSSSCFLTWLSCCAERLARSTDDADISVWCAFLVQHGSY